MDDLCPLCALFQESTIHALWECSAAQDVWHGNVRALQKCGIGLLDFVALLEYLLDRLNKTEVEMFLVQAWLIWNQRNRVVYGGKLLELGWLNRCAAELLEEFQQSQVSLQADAAVGATRQVVQNDGTRWIPPPQAVYKLNYNAAMFEDSTSTGFGAVIRNSTRKVMVAMTVKGPVVQGSEMAELLACRKVLELTIDAGFTMLIVEGDNFNATRCIALGSDIQSAIGHVVEDIKHLLGALEWASVSCT